MGTHSAPHVNIDFPAFMESVLLNLKIAIEHSGASVQMGDLPDSVLGNEAQLGQLFQNLIGNGIKFRGESAPVIEISAEPLGESHWKFRVQDNGIGIHPDYKDRVFVIFQRLHTREQYDGTGIGLAVCKRVVERHEGEIWLESEEGKGTTFYFTLAGAEAIPQSLALAV